MKLNLLPQDTQTAVRNARKAGWSEQEIAFFVAQDLKKTQQTPQSGQPMSMGQGTQITTPMQNPQATQPQGFSLTNFVKAIARPAVDLGKDFAGMAIAGNLAVPELVSRVTVDRQNKNKTLDRGIEAGMRLMRDETREAVLDEDPLARKAIKRGVQLGADTASYVLPAGKSVKGAIALGGLSSGLSAGSQEGATVEDVLTATGVGMVTGGTVKGGSRILSKGVKLPNKLSSGLAKQGERIEISAYTKGVGSVPIKKEGGSQLLLRMRDLGYKAGDADSIIEQTNEVLSLYNPIIGDQMDELTRKGTWVDVAPLRQALKDKIKKNMLPSDRSTIEGMLEEIDGFTNKKRKIDPSVFYELKQRLGGKGRWNSNSSNDDIAKAELWKDLYIKANDMTDELLAKNGFNDFREINNAIHTAMNAQAWAERVANKAPSVNSFGLLDSLTFLAGYGASGLPTGVALMGARKALNSPNTAKSLGKALQGAGDKLGGVDISLPDLGNKGRYATNVLTSTIGKSVAGKEQVDNGIEENGNQNTNTDSFEHDVNIDPLEADVNIPGIDGTEQSSDVFGGMSKPQVLQEALRQGATQQDLEMLSTVYDMVQEQEQVGAETFVQEEDQMPYTPRQLAIARQKALAVGNMEAYKQLTEMYQIAKEEEEREAKLTTKKEAKLSDSAIKNINDMRGALVDIDNLAKNIEGSGLIGPVRGRAVANPYANKSRALQAEIDRVRQVVGKALEGGVLKKEDEIKYAKILPTMNDTEEVALTKLSELKQKLSEDLLNYMMLQQTVGKGSGLEDLPDTYTSQ